MTSFTTNLNPLNTEHVLLLHHVIKTSDTKTTTPITTLELITKIKTINKDSIRINNRAVPMQTQLVKKIPIIHQCMNSNLFITMIIIIITTKLRIAHLNLNKMINFPFNNREHLRMMKSISIVSFTF